MIEGIEVSTEVAGALGEGRAVVALESTLIAHGLPHPHNLDTARALEAAVRAGGAVPATIAVLGGRARVGLEAADLERLAAPGSPAVKCGAADLAAVMAAGGDGATTVSATAVLAARVGVAVFATGGIGGVHRGDAGDVSSDLEVLARTPIAVVSAGAKAILDLPRTLEALDSLGVLVVGYRTGELPAFYSRESGLSLEHRVERPEDIADILRLRWGALAQGGVLVANPVPEEAAIPRQAVESVIERACAAAASGGIRGKALTPFLLRHIAGELGPAALAANRALAVANAGLAAAIAAALAAGPWSEGGPG